MTCPDCMTDTPHAFRVRVRDIDGPAWWVAVNAMGPLDARNLAREKAYDAGAIEPGVVTVDHADPWREAYGPEAAGLAAYQAEGR